MGKKLLFLVIAVVPQLFAQHTLENYLQAAYRNNPQLKEFSQAHANSVFERERIRAENSLPKIGLAANVLLAPYFNNHGKPFTVDPGPEAIGYDVAVTNGGLYSATVNVDKNILNGYLIDALDRQVAVREEAATNNVLLLKHEIARQVTDQYLQTYLSMKYYELDAQVLSYLDKEQSVAEKLAANGLIKESDDLLLKIEAENQANALNSSEAQFKTSLSQLLALCGMQDTTVTRIDSVSLIPAPTAGVSAFYRKYELDSLALAVEQSIVESKYQPQISLFLNTGLNAVELEGIGRKFGMSAGINFSLPIYDGNQKSITRQQNELSIVSVSYYREYFFTQLKTYLNNSRDRIRILKNNRDRYEREVGSYEKVIDISEKEFRQGVRSMVDYLTILRNFVDLRKNLAKAENDYEMEINNYNYWNW
jgi:outer membrane protein TolC